MRTSYAFLFFLCLTLASAAHSQSTINFDDISATGWGSQTLTAIPNGYSGLNWNNFGVENTTQFPASGFVNGTVSPANIAFNVYGNPASLSSDLPFIFVSGYFTSGAGVGMSLEISGLNGTRVVFDEMFTVSLYGPSFLSFPSTPVTEVDFTTTGGTSPGPGYVGGGPVMVLDNVTIAPVPEPSACLLVGIGLGALAWQRRKCHRDSSLGK
jgi:hypothetical protein